MATQSLLPTEEMRRKAIGIEGKPATLEVEKGAIRQFAEAVGDPNPLWNDDVTARKSRYGGLIAPPTFLRCVRPESPELPFENPLTACWMVAASGSISSPSGSETTSPPWPGYRIWRCDQEAWAPCFS